MFVKLNLKAFSVSIFAFLLLSCQKGANETIEPAPKELIIGSWQMTGHVQTPATRDLNSDGIKDADVYSFFGTCFKDNLIIFRADGTCEENEGPTKCEPEHEQVYVSPWSMSPDQKTITIDDDFYTILQISNTTLKLSSVDETTSITVTDVITLTKK